MVDFSKLFQDMVVVGLIMICLFQVACSLTVISFIEEIFGSLVVDLGDKVDREVVEGHGRQK
jgi:hypothetical protein